MKRIAALLLWAGLSCSEVRLRTPDMVTHETQTAALPGKATWDDVRNAALRVLAGRGYLLPRHPVVFERAHFLRTPWENVEPRELPDGRTGLTNELRIKRVERMHSVRVVYYPSGIKVIIDCAERWPDVPNWETCDDQRNERFARSFVGVAKQISDEVVAAMKARGADDATVGP
jgi:hypothetical protein